MILSSTGCQTAVVVSVMIVETNSQHCEDAIIVGSVARSSVANAATRNYLARSWDTEEACVYVHIVAVS